MTKSQKNLINEIKALYDEHDHAEALIVMTIRRLGIERACDGLMDYHDELEHDIMEREALLPQKIVEKLKRGKL